MEKDGMCLPGVGTPQEDHIRFLDFAVGTGSATRPENRRQTGDAGSMSSTVAAINVVAADDGANEFLRGVVQFVGGFGTTKHAKRARAMQRHLFLKPFRSALHCFVPCRRALFAIFADERSCQPIIRLMRHNGPPNTQREKERSSQPTFILCPRDSPGGDE